MGWFVSRGSGPGLVDPGTDDLVRGLGPRTGGSLSKGKALPISDIIGR
jgi:hypothetical protein